MSLIRALVITPTPTHPSTQGNRVRVVQVAEALKQRGMAVDLFYYALDGYSSDSVEAMREAWDHVFTVGTEGFRFERRYPAFWGLDDWIAPSALLLCRRLAEVFRYDLVVANYVWCSALLEPFRRAGAKVLIDTHDAFGGRHDIARATGMTPNWFYTSIAEENRGFGRADAVIAIQDEEGQLFRSRSDTKVYTIEYSKPPIALRQSPVGRIKVGYLGSANPWNVRSVKMFDEYLAALVEQGRSLDRFEFLLYGGVCQADHDFRVLQRQGPVDQVEDFYQTIDVVVNPMVGGTGLKIKTVEALAFGRYVLSTSSGGAGLEHIHPDLGLADFDAMVDRLDRIVSRDDAVARGAEMAARYEEFHLATQAKIAAMLAEIGV